MKIHGIAGLTEIFGGSRATWTKRLEAGMPVFQRQPEHSGKPHIFDSLDVYAWLLALATARTDEALDPKQERAKLDEARRRIAELEYRRKCDELVDADEIESTWCRLVSDFRAGLLAIPNRAAPLLVHKDAAQMADILKGLLYEAMAALADAP